MEFDLDSADAQAATYSMTTTVEIAFEELADPSRTDAVLEQLSNSYRDQLPQEPKDTQTFLLGRLAGTLKSPLQYPTSSVTLIIRFFVATGLFELLLPVLFENLNRASKDDSVVDLWVGSIYPELCRPTVASPDSFSTTDLRMIDRHCQPLVHVRTKALLADMFFSALVAGAQE